jgi:hypothetical protein
MFGSTFKGFKIDSRALELILTLYSKINFVSRIYYTWSYKLF